MNNTSTAQTVTVYDNGRVSGTINLDVYDTAGSNPNGSIPASGSLMIGVDGHEVPLTNAGGYEVYSTGGGASIRAENDGIGTSMTLTGAFLTDGSESQAEPGLNKTMTFDKVIQGDSDTCRFRCHALGSRPEQLQPRFGDLHPFAEQPDGHRLRHSPVRARAGRSDQAGRGPGRVQRHVRAGRRPFERSR